jgi:hypothetical protein
MNRHGIALGMVGLLAAIAPLQAQRNAPARPPIAGFVTDLSTGNPVPLAVVEFAALRRYALTDARGAFSIAGVPPGKHKVTVSQLGFKTMVREVTVDGEPLMLPLDPDPVLLKGINVQVDRLEVRRRAAGVSIQAFQREELLNVANFSAGDFVKNRLLMIPCMNGRSLCIRSKGQTIQPTIYIDERRAFGLEELSAYPTYDLYLVEAYDSGRCIRVYTNWFMQHLARGGVRLQPLTIC